MNITEIRMFRWMDGNTLKERIKMRSYNRLASIENKMKRNRLRWFFMYNGGPQE